MELIDGDPIALRYEDQGRAFAGRCIPRPSDAPARGAVLIAPDWRGLSPFALHEAARLSRVGFDVAVMDLYGDGLYTTDESRSGSLIGGLNNDRRSGVSRMNKCINAFSHQVQISSVVLLGYSIGGMVSLDCARSGAELAGVVLCSALLKPAEPGTPTAIAAPVLAVHGTRDVVSPMAVVTDLAREFDEAGNDLTLVLFSDTHHGFYNPEAGSDPRGRVVYSAEASTRSRDVIDRFLSTTLR